MYNSNGIGLATEDWGELKPYEKHPLRWSKYGTPWNIFRNLDNEFHFTLDACASKENAKCKKYFCEETEDGLRQSWAGEIVFCNPPYGQQQLYKWILKAVYERDRAKVIVMLLPVSTSTKWFHDYIWDVRYNRPRPNVELRLLKKRVKFVGANGSPKFDSMVVVFRPSKMKRKIKV